MELTEPLQFDHADRKDIYEYVESHGSVDPEEARRALRMEPHPFGHHVAIMKRDGVLKTEDGELRIAYEDGGEEEFQADDVEFTIRQARQEDLTGLVGAIRDAIATGDDEAFAVTQLDDVLVCRYLGAQAQRARQCLTAAWRLIRPALLGREACVPRVWHT